MSTSNKSNANPTSIVVIVESPSKCKKIEQFLNKHNSSSGIQYNCIASYGHIREMNGLESININDNFKPMFIESKSKKDQIAKIKKAIKEADEVILASDDDREGEAIAWHICQVFNLSVENTKRILFHEITEPALHRAIETPTRVNMPMVNAQIARQVLDILVGYKLSPLLWKHIQDGLSAGRCQTPALRLIYENQKEIEKSPGKQSYVVTAYFTNKNIPFVLNHEEPKEAKMRDFLTESLTFNHTFKEYTLKNKTSAHPKPFTTSTIQQTASNELHISPKETMSLCQKLYEGGYITYPRTDSTNYSEEFNKKMKDCIIQTYGEAYVEEKKEEPQKTPQKKPTNNAKTTKTAKTEKTTEQPHEAIRITDLKCEDLDKTTYTSKENRMYRLIRKRTFESSMADATLSVLNAIITAPLNHDYHFQTEKVIFPGWKIIGGYDDVNKEYTYLQSMKSNLSMPYRKIKANIHLKETKQHYTEARLVQLLEEKGIGRPSTFSSLIDKIQERKYVKKENVKGKLITCNEFEIIADTKHEEPRITEIQNNREFGNEKNKLVITPTGIMALEFLLKHFDTFFQYSYTKKMEDDLDSVAKGNKVWYDICKIGNDEIENLSSSILERGKETIRIDDEHTYMIGKYGPVIKCSLTNGNSRGKKSDVSFKAVRKDIDLNKLRNGEYTLEEILETAENKQQAQSIGLFQEKAVYVKTGKFGKYLEWNGVSKSLKHLKMEVSEVTMDDVAETLYDIEADMAGATGTAGTGTGTAGTGTAGTGSGNSRIITEDVSIRKGKYGYYIFYKTKKMKKPRFLKLDGFKNDYLTCDIELIKEWFVKTYKVEL